MRWKILWEEFSPEIVYIKGNDNTVADALSRLPKKGSTREEPLGQSDEESDNQEDTPGYSESHYHAQMCFAMQEFTEHNHSEDSYVQDDIEEDDEPFPLDLENIKQEQKQDKDLQLRVATNKK